MTNPATRARELAVHMEAKKDGLSQLQAGTWKLTLVVHQDDMPESIMRAAMGQRYQVALVAIGDDEEPQKPLAVGGNEGTQGDKKERRKWADIPPSQQAGIRCNDPKFREWAMIAWLLDGPEQHLVENVVRNECGISSRSELDTSKLAQEFWRQIDSQYLKDTGQIAEDRS